MKKIFHVSPANENKIAGPRFSVMNLIKCSNINLTENLLVTNQSGVEFFSKHLKEKQIYTYTSLLLLIFLRRIKPNDSIFIFHSTFILKSYFLSIILKIIQFKYAIYPRGGFTKEALKIKFLKKKIFLSLFFKRFFSNSHAIIYLNKKEKLNSFIFTKNYFISPNGVDPKFFELRKKNLIIKNIGNNTLNTGLISRLDVYHKGIDTYFNYAKEFKLKNSFFELRLNLMGPKTKKFEELINLYPHDFANIYKPSTLISKKIDFLNNLDIFICLSRFEGQPQALLEAISIGLPVIVSEGSNMFSEVKEYNIGWGVKNFSDFSLAINEFSNLDFEERNEISKRCMAFADKFLKWDIIAKNFQKKAIKNFNK